tara:strand:+ start:1891 stop:2004 length:114 start_codon:yes stop_codon:yes gene_type:complete
MRPKNPKVLTNNKGPETAILPLTGSNNSGINNTPKGC